MPKPMRDEERPEGGAAASLFTSFSRELRAFVRRRLRSTNQNQVDDVFQEVFERFVRIEKTVMIRDPNAFICGMAVNVIHEFNYRQVRESRFVDSGASLEDAGDRLESSIADDSERLNLSRQIEGALDSLPEAHRAVLVCCKRDGMSYEEASRATGLSTQQVERYLMQARAKLTTLLWDI